MTPHEAEIILICGTQSFFPDDRIGACFICSRAIYFRSHSARLVRKVCIPCAAARMRTEEKPIMGMSERCAQEVAEYLAGLKKN